MTEANDEVIDDVTDVTDDNDTNDSSDDYVPTVEDYEKEKSRREKAEKTLVEQKRRLKELEAKESTQSGEFVTKADLVLEKFLDKNPELADYTKELWDYQKKGLSLDEAKTLILNSDKARVNREKVNSLGLSDWETSSKKSSYNIKELDKLASSNPSEYARVRNEMDAGKIKLDR